MRAVMRGRHRGARPRPEGPIGPVPLVRFKAVQMARLAACPPRTGRRSQAWIATKTGSCDAAFAALGAAGVPNPIRKAQFRLATMEWTLATVQPDGCLRGKDGRLRGKDGCLRGKDGRLRGKDGRLRGKDGRLRGKDGCLRGKDGRLRGKDGRLRGDDMDDGLQDRLLRLQGRTVWLGADPLDRSKPARVWDPGTDRIILDGVHAVVRGAVDDAARRAPVGAAQGAYAQADTAGAGDRRTGRDDPQAAIAALAVIPGGLSEARCQTRPHRPRRKGSNRPSIARFARRAQARGDPTPAQTVEFRWNFDNHRRRNAGTRETGTRETGTRETGARETGARETGHGGASERAPCRRPRARPASLDGRIQWHKLSDLQRRTAIRA